LIKNDKYIMCMRHRYQNSANIAYHLVSPHDQPTHLAAQTTQELDFTNSALLPLILIPPEEPTSLLEHHLFVFFTCFDLHEAIQQITKCSL